MTEQDAGQAEPAAATAGAIGPDDAIVVRDVELRYGDLLIQSKLTFTVKRGEIFVLMGGSGCGKTTVMRTLAGLKEPAQGQVFLDGTSFWEAPSDEQEQLKRKCGVVYQSGALWSSLTLAENIALPLQTYTDLDAKEILELAKLKLALVGLAGYEDFYPSEISGGMRKRAGVARGLALDPEFLMFDEPSAGLDPITSSRLDDLILDLRDSLGATMIMVTHELPSIFTVADNSVYLDNVSKTMIAAGDPKRLVTECPDPKVRAFLTRGGKEKAA